MISELFLNLNNIIKGFFLTVICIATIFRNMVLGGDPAFRINENSNINILRKNHVYKYDYYPYQN